MRELKFRAYYIPDVLMGEPMKFIQKEIIDLLHFNSKIIGNICDNRKRID